MAEVDLDAVAAAVREQVRAVDARPEDSVADWRDTVVRPVLDALRAAVAGLEDEPDEPEVLSDR